MILIHGLMRRVLEGLHQGRTNGWLFAIHLLQHAQKSLVLVNVFAHLVEVGVWRNLWLLIGRVLSLYGGNRVLLLPVGAFAEHLMAVALQRHISLKRRVLFLLEVRLLMLLRWKLVAKLLELRHDDASI